MAQDPSRIDITKAQTKKISHLQMQVQKEQKTMFDFKLKTPEYTAMETVENTVESWADRTCVSKRSLKRFLETLTPTQLAQAEVMVDDENYVVFYPVLSGVGVAAGLHFDNGGLSTGSLPSKDAIPPHYSLEASSDTDSCSQPKTTYIVNLAAENGQQTFDFGELNQAEWQQALKVLLSSVRLL